MAIQSQPLTEQEHKAILSICILSAFADGAQDEVERAQIERIVNGFAEAHIDLANVYQDVLGGKLTLASVAGQLQSETSKTLAYEMAVCVCHADGIVKEPEKQFLTELRQALELDKPATEAHQQAAEAIVAQPLNAPVPPVIDLGREAEL